jgi:protein tyrosine/serine phosphatase
MMITIKSTTSLLVAAAISVASSLMVPSVVRAEESATPLINNEILSQNTIKNFQQIDDGVLRGAQPGDKNLKVLHASGVKTILDLRQPGKLVERESATAKSLGLEYINIPLGFRSPDQSTMTRILAIINDKTKQPVFVHCRQGADRTGMTCGMYRVLHDNWEFNRTYEEMRKHHFKPVLLGMKDAVRKCQLNQRLVSAINPSLKTTLKTSEQVAAVRVVRTD